MQGKRESNKGHMGILNLKLVGTKNRRGRVKKVTLQTEEGLGLILWF